MLCLISASSSMNMQRVWQERTKCLPSEVVTLLTLKSAEESELAVHALERRDLVDVVDQLTSARDLRIVGERFSPEDVPPKLFLLKANHRLDDLYLNAFDFSKAVR